MAERIAQSTSYELAFKAFLTTTGAEATGVTIAITISKNGATSFSNPSGGATNATEIGSGWYFVVLTTGDTDTLGRLAVRGTSATINDVGQALTVISATTGGATNLDAAITSRMATYTQPTGFLAATFPSGTIANTTNLTAGTIATVTNQLTGAQIATAIWQDATAGDFTTASSIGKALYTGNVVPGGAGGLFIAGTNAATTITTGLTTTFTGNLTGSVGSVTARVTANADQLAGQTVTAAAGVTFPASVASPTNITAGTITTVTNLTNAPTNGDLTAAMIASVTTAATAATPTAAAVTGSVGSVAVGGIVSTSFGANALDAVWSTATRVLTAGTNIGFPTANQNADALLDRADALETGITVRMALRGYAASMLGKLSGAGTTNILIRDINDTKNVVDATVDASGNRSAITLDLT